MRHKHAIALVTVSLADVMMQRTDGTPFDRNDFQQYPAAYRSVFVQRVAPYVDAMPGFPDS